MWMKLEYEMSLIYLFHIHLPYQRSKILSNYVDHVNIKYWERIISFTNVFNDLVIKYNTSTIMNNDIIYHYTSFFIETCCADNILNVRPKLENTVQ